jgi:hypothetical protein
MLKMLLSLSFWVFEFILNLGSGLVQCQLIISQLVFFKIVQSSLFNQLKELDRMPLNYLIQLG